MEKHLRVEVCALSCERSRAAALAFLNEFLPKRNAAADEYPYPEFAPEPTDVYVTEQQILDRLDAEPCATYALYWDSASEGEPYGAMLFFLRDSSLVVGLDVQSESIEYWLQRLAVSVGADFGYVTGSVPPPDTAQEFRAACARADAPRLISGTVHARTGRGS